MTQAKNEAQEVSQRDKGVLRIEDRTPGAEIVANAILQNYEIKDTNDISSVLKEVFAPIFEQLLKTELRAHLGFDKSEYGDKPTTNRHNGYSKKTVKTKEGEVEVKVPRDREGSFEPIILPKHKRDVSDIEGKVISMYARGMSMRDISATVEDIYGFSLSHDQISTITDLVYQDVQEWQNRPLKPVYAFLFADCIYASVRLEHGAKAQEQAIYVILGINMTGHKEVLGIWVKPTESKRAWMNILDSIKQRGVKDVLFFSMDGVTGLSDGVKAIYPEAITQRCIVHLVRNSLIYVSIKDRKEFCKSIKLVYGAVSEEECKANFELFKERWKCKCAGAVRVWESNFDYVLQLFSIPSVVRKVMYTTNAIESVNSSLRKVTKKSTFDSPDNVLKAFYFRISELSKKWTKSIHNWPEVRNVLITDERFEPRIKKYM